MAVEIRDRVSDDIKQAMRAKDSVTLSTLRLLWAAIKQKEIDDRVVLTDQDISNLLGKMIKQRRDSITQFTLGNRPDLVAQELVEIDVLSRYLPAQMSPEAIHTAITAALEQVNPAQPADLGKMMAILKKNIAGSADMSVVSVLAKELLTQYLKAER